MHFKNKIVWITGASSGIGEEIAIQLAKKNAILILTARNETALQNIQKTLETTDNKVYTLAADLTQLENLPILVEKAIAFKGRIDFIIHCAGVSQRELTVNTTLHVHQKLMAINYFAPVAINEKLLPHFIANNSGHITVISSVAGLYGFPLRSGYSASKHAIKGYVETLQTELVHSNIKSLLVFPGRIDTQISVNALTGNGQLANVKDANNKIGMEVSVCVSKIISAIAKGKKSVYIGFSERMLFWIWWFFPTLYFKIANKKGLEK